MTCPPCTHDCNQGETCPAKSKQAAVKRMKEWVEFLKRKSNHGQHMKIPSMMSAATCWELAIELEQFIKNPPQRTEQLKACVYCGQLVIRENT